MYAECWRIARTEAVVLPCQEVRRKLFSKILIISHLLVLHSDNVTDPGKVSVGIVLCGHFYSFARKGRGKELGGV